MGNGLGMESKLNGIEMRKFETKEEPVEWIETMHLQIQTVEKRKMKCLDLE